MSKQISATVIKHSISRADAPIATLSLVYPRFIHSEFMTHRVFSRNAMSSRAVPVAKMIEQVRNDPATPIHWGANRPGMQANGEVSEEHKFLAQDHWRRAAWFAADTAESMAELGLHKQVVNRILEPFQWMHTIVTSTEWDNFFMLRCHEAAEPNMRALAEAMRTALMNSKPVVRDTHLPYFDETEFMDVQSIERAAMVSAARCARVSYLNHDGSNPVIEKDLMLANSLKEANHASPFEHIAFAAGADVRSRNFTGWTQFREVIGL